MRDMLLIIISVFVAVVVGAVGISWYSQSMLAKAAIERSLAKLENAPFHITYESIETSGFPTHLYVSIVKPRFSGRVDELLKALPEYAAMPVWNADIALDGNIVVGVNAWSNQYSVQLSGPVKHSSVIAGQTIAAASLSPENIACNLHVASGSGIFGSLWSFEALARKGEALVEDLRLLDCASTAHTLVDPATNQVLQTMGPARFYISNAPQGDTQELRAYAKVADMEVTAPGDAMMAAYARALNPAHAYPIKHSVYGKQHLDFDFSYNGPADWEKAGNNPTLNVALNRFSLTSLISSYNATFRLTNGMEGNERVNRLAFKAEEQFDPVYDTLLPDLARGAIVEFYANKDPRFAPIRPFIDKYTPEEFYAIAYPLLPNLSSLGKMTQALDATFKGDPDMRSGEVTVKVLELSAAPYGITAQGAVKLATDQLPGGNLSLTCTNCLRLIDDMAGYEARVQKALSALEPQLAATWLIDPKLVEGIKRFAAAIAEPPRETAEKTTFTYTVISDNKGITVSGKPLEEVLALYGQHIVAAQQPPKQKAP